MAITFALTEVTPNRLRYICTDDGSDTITPGTGQIPNENNGSSPDLRADAGTIVGSQIYDLVATPVADQAAARQLLAGEGLTAQSDVDTPRAHMKLTPKNLQAAQIPWAVDADVGAGASTGFAVVNVFGPNVSGALCYLDIEFAHTLTR